CAPSVRQYLRNHAPCVIRASGWKAPGRDLCRAVVVKIREPVVGGGHQLGSCDDLGGNKIERTEAQVVSRINRRVSQQQEIFRLVLPRIGRGLQKIAYCEGCMFTEI